jgi:hypothetical protein
VARFADKHNHPCIECPRGRWVTIQNNNLYYIGLNAGDLVCVLPSLHWPAKGPVLMMEEGREKVCYVELADEGESIRLHEGEGSWKYMPVSHATHQLIGWIVRVVRYYEEPPPASLRLVDSTADAEKQKYSEPINRAS